MRRNGFNRMHRQFRGVRIVWHAVGIGGHYNKVRTFVNRRLKSKRPRDIILLYVRQEDLSSRQQQRLHRTIRETAWTYERGFNDL